MGTYVVIQKRCFNVFDVQCYGDDVDDIDDDVYIGGSHI